MTVINNIEFARKALEIHDTITISHLGRLTEFVASAEGELQYNLRGWVGAEGEPEMGLEVRGVLQLICQRCLEQMPFDLDVGIHYVIVADESLIPQEEGDRDYLVADDRMNVVELIEDEVLLALPLAPRHPEGACMAAGISRQAEKQNPFSVLNSLKPKG